MEFFQIPVDYSSWLVHCGIINFDFCKANLSNSLGYRKF